jgi:beta-lactamase regulating signal transducer with metallopeptidase domain
MIDLSSFAQWSQDWAELALAVTLKGSLLLAFVGLLTVSLRRGSAATRHALWTMGVVALLLMPAAMTVVPAWEVSLPGTWSSLDRRPLTDVNQPMQRAEVPLEPTAFPTPSPQADTASMEFSPLDPVTQSVPFVPEVRNTSWWASSRAILTQIPIAGWLLFLWETGVLLVLLAMGLGLVRLWWLSRRANPLWTPEWTGLIDTTARELGMGGDVRLLEGSDVVTPMTWGLLRPTLLLPRAARTWSAEQRRDVVLHELAHVRRRDCLTQALAQLACALFWFNPLVWIAAAQMRMERERACDDQVLLAGSKASSYASHLLEMARSLKPERCTSMASVAMARRSQLSDRLVAVLDPRPRRAPRPALTWTTAAIALLAMLPLAALDPAGHESQAQASERGARYPGRTAWTFESPSRPWAPKTFELARPSGDAYVIGADGRQIGWVRPGVSVSVAPEATAIAGDVVAYTSGVESPVVAITDTDGLEVSATRDGYEVTADRTHWVHSDDDYGLSIELDGELEFNEDFDDIIGMSDDAYFELEEKTRDRSRRRMELELGRDGTVERTYFERGRRAEYDDAAQQWFHEALAHAVRVLAIGAEQRLDRIYRRDGVAGVLDEIDEVDSDFARARYYRAFLSLDGVDRQDTKRVLDQATRDIDSDFELANLLIGSLAEYMSDEELRGAYLDAAKSIDSDFEKRRVLSAALEDHEMPAPEMAAVLDAIEGIDSDFEAGQLLQYVTPGHLAHPGLRGSYFRAIGNLDSDFEQSRILSELLAGDHLDREGMILLLESVQDIDSDFEAARLLTMSAEHYLDEDAEMRELFFRAVSALDSDFERSRVLKHLMAEEDLSPESQLLVLENIDDMDSDFEKTNLLIDLAGEDFASEEVREAYLHVVDGIDSDHEYGRAMKALRRAERNRREG